MFGLMRVKTHNRLIQDAVDRALKTGMELGVRLPEIKYHAGTDLAIQQIQAVCDSKIGTDWQGDDQEGRDYD